jgi:hypothetical protein
MDAKVLAGPILRRTTKNRVCVWLATSGPMSLQLTVTDAKMNPLGQSQLASLGEQQIKLGKNLHVYLLQARADDSAGYPHDALMYYRLDKVEGAAVSPLFADDELKKLVYGSHPYPGFFIPSRLRHLLHGSCRKPHGGFDSKEQTPMPDALSHAHTLLEDTCDDLERRPALLLLTGDQIYADDVGISLLAMLRRQALALTGLQETLPLKESATSPGSRLDPSTIPLHGRKQALADYESGFSSGESENHLFTFGEFAAMYIYSFGNVPGWEPVWDWEQVKRLGVTEGDAEKGAEEAWAAQLAPLRSFHGTLSSVRRALANLPTYMIFDDHDVTDDWNITGAWYDAVRGSPMGRRIVSNALAACWGFQAWGDDPDNFDKDLVLTITQRLNETGNDGDIGERYDLHTWKDRGWGFSIPTEPPIIAVDSRTQRQYENKYYPAQLLDRYALDWLRVEWAKLKTGQKIGVDTCPVLITTTPVMGFHVVETIQEMLLASANWLEKDPLIRLMEQWTDMEGCMTTRVVNAIDAESWSSNRDGFVAFMDTLCTRMGIVRCVFLSGDVHYAFTATAGYTHGDSKLQCCQLTSSAQSNQPSEMQSRFLEKAARHKTGYKAHGHWSPFPGRRWRAEVQLLEENRGNRVNAICNLGLVEFADGQPVSHTLLTGSGRLVYRLPRMAG